MRGWLLTKTESGIEPRFGEIDTAGLPAGDVLVRVNWSSLNYKDGLAMTGAPGVVRMFPMVPGIDLAGVVEESSSPSFAAGDAVIFYSAGVRRTGGYDASVIDQGSGIPAHAHSAVFERFFRGDPSRSRDQASASGAGLGLSLARWIARAHGGDIVVTSSGPTGTTFTVSLAAGEEARL